MTMKFKSKGMIYCKYFMIKDNIELTQIAKTQLTKNLNLYLSV